MSKSFAWSSKFLTFDKDGEVIRTVKTDILRFIECWDYTPSRPKNITDTLTGIREGNTPTAKVVWEEVTRVASEVLRESKWTVKKMTFQEIPLGPWEICMLQPGEKI